MPNNQTKFVAQPGKQEVIVTREFDAPRELVFKAYTEPEMVKQWLGPKGFEMTIDKWDAIDGGSWRYIHTDTAGNKFAFHGVFHEILPPERAIQTFEYEGLPEKGHVNLDTAKFESLPDNRTRVTILTVFQDVASRDGMVSTGMERGMTEGFERLDELLAKELSK